MENLKPSSVLEHWFAVRGSAPAITFYGDEGVRIELSGASAANTVNKAVNLFQHELLLDPGDLVWLDLPTCHWQTPLLAVAAWAAGLSVAIGDRPPDHAAATLGSGARGAVGVPLAVSTHPWGMPLGPLTPAGWDDFGDMMRIQPDLAAFRWTPPQDPWLIVGAGTPLAGAELLDRAARLLATWDVAPAGRLVSDLPLTTVHGLLACTLVPALADGSVILATFGDEMGIARQEGNVVRASHV